jgi:hypothetical protein
MMALGLLAVSACSSQFSNSLPRELYCKKSFDYLPLMIEGRTVQAQKMGHLYTPGKAEGIPVGRYVYMGAIFLYNDPKSDTRMLSRDIKERNGDFKTEGLCSRGIYAHKAVQPQTINSITRFTVEANGDVMVEEVGEYTNHFDGSALTHDFKRTELKPPVPLETLRQQPDLHVLPAFFQLFHIDHSKSEAEHYELRSQQTVADGKPQPNSETVTLAVSYYLCPPNDHDDACKF